MPDSVKTKRKGARGARDRLVFYKHAWDVAEKWAGFPKALVYWLALTPLAITSFNAFVGVFGLPFEIPIAYGSSLAVLFVLVLMVFGFLAWTRLGLKRRSAELAGKQNPTYFMLYNKIEDVMEEIKELKQEMKELKK